MATLLTKRSNTAGSVPLAAQLTNSAGGAELAVNTADKRLFVKDNAGNVVELGISPGSMPTYTTGTANGVAYLNGSKVLTTGSGLVFDGTTFKVTTSVGNNAFQATDGTRADLLVDFPATAYTRFKSQYFTQGGFIFSSGSGNTEFMRLDLLGNLGLGVTPSAWTTYKALQVSSQTAIASTGNYAIFASNWYYNGAERYIANGNATRYYQGLGAHVWETAPSGTAGNAISFTQAMTLDASGRLGIGRTDPGNYGTLAVSGTIAPVSPNGQTQGVFSAADTGQINIGGYNGSGTNFITFQAGGGTERARIDNNGYFMVNSTSVVDAGRVSITFPGNANIGIGFKSTFNGSFDVMRFFNSAGVQQGYINCNNAGSTTYNSGSDYRLKENVQPMTDGLSKVMALAPVTFNWKADGSAGQGFIAHELQAVVPDVVNGEKDGLAADGSIKPQGVDYGKLTAILAAAIQEQQALIQAQQADLAALTQRIAALEGASSGQ